MIKIKKAGRPSSVDQWVSSCLFAHVCSQQRLQLGLSHTFHSLSYDYSSLNWVKTHFEFFYVGYGGNNWIFILGWFGVWQITGKSFNSISGKYLGPGQQRNDYFKIKGWIMALCVILACREEWSHTSFCIGVLRSEPSLHPKGNNNNSI